MWKGKSTNGSIWVQMHFWCLKKTAEGWKNPLCSKWGFTGIRVTCLGSGKAFVLYYYKNFPGLINGMMMRGIAFDLIHKCITLVWEWWDKRVPLLLMGNWLGCLNSAGWFSMMSGQTLGSFLMKCCDRCTQKIPGWFTSSVILQKTIRLLWGRVRSFAFSIAHFIQHYYF